MTLPTLTFPAWCVKMYYMFLHPSRQEQEATVSYSFLSWLSAFPSFGLLY